MKATHLLGAAGILLTGSAALADYAPGDSWHRLTDFTPGVLEGTTTNNPGADFEGAAVWSHEWIDTTEGSEVWYDTSTELLTWDASWWASERGAWTRGDNQSAVIFENWMTHNLHSSQSHSVPVVRWINPAGDGAEVDLAGNLNVLWSGAGGLGKETDVSVVVGLFDASTGGITALLEETHAKPTAGESIGDTIDIPVEFTSVILDAGDSIFVTVRGHETFHPSGAWIDMRDDMRITLVPAPATIALGGLGLCAARRRR